MLTHPETLAWLQAEGEEGRGSGEVHWWCGGDICLSAGTEKAAVQN